MGRYLVKLKKNDDVISNSNVRRHNHHFYVMTTREVESPYCFFVFGWIKLEFGLRDNFRSSDFKSELKNAVSVQNLKKMPLFFS